MLNGQERTLREHAELCFSAGWKIIHVVKAKETNFGYYTAIPVTVPR
jgi:hypothetical protein